MRHSRWSESRGLLWILAALMLGVTALDLAFPSISVLPAMILVVMAAALLVGPQGALWLGVLAIGLTLFGELAHQDFSSPSGWLEFVTIVLAAPIAVALASELESQRQRMREREEQFRMLAENASDIVVHVSRSGDVDWISPSVKDVLGWEPEEIIGTRPWDLIHPDDRERAAQSSAEAGTAGRDMGTLEIRFLKADGSYVWLSAAGSPAPQGAFVVSFRQVDEEVRARQALIDSQSQYRLLAENAMDLVFALDLRGVIQWVSPSVRSMLEYDSTELIGESGAVLVNPADLPLLLQSADVARGGSPASCQIRMVSRSGQDRWVEATPRTLTDEDGELIGGVIGVRDIDAEVRTRSALAHAVDFDRLTGLAKRDLALARIGDVLAARRDRSWALICIGVNAMTSINVAYTYAAGDAVLRAVADRLVASAGGLDQVARIAGDEFVVIAPDINDATGAARAAARFLDAVRGPVAIDDVIVDVTACAGIAMAGGTDAEGLLRDSTAAMRQAASMGPDRWEFLDGNVGETTRHALSVQRSLRDSIRSGGIAPWLMPIVRLADGAVVGHEVLARWIRPDGTIGAPADFLTIAEQSGLIIDIDETMLRNSFDLLTESDDIERLAVNVAAATLASGTLTPLVASLLATSGVDPRRLHLEVTETSLFQVTQAVRHTMQEIAGLGVSWWVDDFGTGFSSISHLRDLPISGMKLDQSFTAGLNAADPQAVHLAQGLVGLANGLGLETIAEGIETPEQASVLLSQGWVMGQGWLYGRPAPAPTTEPAAAR